MRVIAALLVCWIALSVNCETRADEALPQRWLYLQQNLQVTENLDKIEQILRRAAKSGYNGVVLADYKLNILDRVPQHYFKNAARFQSLCHELKLEIIPTVMSFGYSDGILAHDPNLAEGLPAKDVPFRVTGNTAAPKQGGKNMVPGDFEERRGDAFVGWGFQDEPGQGTYADTSVKHGGASSLRISNPPGTSGNRRVNKRLTVRPWSQFHASVWIKTDALASAKDFRMFAMSPSGRVLAHSSLGVQKTQDWTQHHVVFNSLESSEILFYLGVWGCGTGNAWIDDVQVVEEPFVNLVRRPSCPLVVTNAGKDIVYEEGRDYAPLHDTKLGMTPWAGSFDVYHTPPELKLMPDSRIKDCQDLHVSFFHAVTIYDNQMPCSLTEPKVFEIVEDQTRRVQELFKPTTYFMSHDEIRVANWSEPERASKLTAGQQLAANVKRCTEIIRRVNPQAKLCVWSDMFDPHHNAVKEFYLVNGDLAGSWEGLPKDCVVINWNSGKAKQSLSFFGERGHTQIAAGFYDAGPETVKKWIAAGQGLNTLRGAMYTTWINDFSQLERFAEIAWGGAK